MEGSTKGEAPGRGGARGAGRGRGRGGGHRREEVGEVGEVGGGYRERGVGLGRTLLGVCEMGGIWMGWMLGAGWMLGGEVVDLVGVGLLVG